MINLGVATGIWKKFFPKTNTGSQGSPWTGGLS